MEMHDLSRTGGLAAAILLCLSLSACQPVVGDEEQETPTSEAGASAPDMTSTAESGGTTLAGASTGPGNSELSSSTTTAHQPPVYSAVGPNELGFKYRWIQVQKYDPVLEFCVTVHMIEDPGQSQPGFDDVEMWGIWRVETGWIRAPVANCQDQGVELTLANAVRGRVAAEADDNSPCTLPLVELSIDFPQSDASPPTDMLVTDDLVVEGAFWCG